ncbi:hypothetical protein HPB47_005587 [Ixodes persulcatus]|uniref:Uncharacterized protein n=1 Tax=Ixodes persulcatus TaxID=34615 RepID=A0AC60PDF4_IXOPE|nr:hypothetical protein HPB47_005587 [Ixodes persulcatus]
MDEAKAEEAARGLSNVNASPAETATASAIPANTGPASHSIAATQQLFQRLLVASGADEFKAPRRAAILLHSLGVEGQRQYNVVAASSRPPELVTGDGGKSASGAAPDEFTTSLELVRRIFAATTNVPVKRHRFKQRIRRAGESMDVYIRSLRNIAVKREYDSTTDVVIRDQLV